MTSQQPGLAGSSEPSEEDRVHHAAVALRSMGELPNAVAGQFNFWDNSYEGRRLFSEVLGTFFLVLVAAGGGMVNARFGGNAIPLFAQVIAPGMMVAAIILFMGTVSGAHLNPGVSIAFAMRGDFPWRRVPAYVVAQFLGAILATLLLWRSQFSGRTRRPVGRGPGCQLALGIAPSRTWWAPSSRRSSTLAS